MLLLLLSSPQLHTLWWLIPLRLQRLCLGITGFWLLGNSLLRELAFLSILDTQKIDPRRKPIGKHPGPPPVSPTTDPGNHTAHPRAERQEEDRVSGWTGSAVPVIQHRKVNSIDGRVESQWQHYEAQNARSQVFSHSHLQTEPVLFLMPYKCIIDVFMCKSESQ